MTFRFKRDAEAYERKMKGEQEEIRRGLRGAPPPPEPFEAICSYWLEHRASQKRSGHHDESIIRAHLRPAFGSLMVHEIGVAKIDAFAVARAHLAERQAGAKREARPIVKRCHGAHRTRPTSFRSATMSC